MRRNLLSFLILSLLCFFIATMPAFAQGTAEAKAPKRAEAAKVLASLNLSDEELKSIEAILAKDETDLAKDRADIQVLQAQLSRLMLDKDPGMDAAGAIVKKSLDLEYSVRMIQLGRQIQIKKLLGDERWATLYRFMRTAREAERTGRLKEFYDTKRMDKAQLEAWKRLLSLSRRAQG
jgi:Na+-transporting methylmalonyl-CoA/oxaloacetate decarboxylase gamma subunit